MDGMESKFGYIPKNGIIGVFRRGVSKTVF
jgi:hypothetical protein